MWPTKDCEERERESLAQERERESERERVRDLRRALQRLAAAVMWRDGVPMPQLRGCVSACDRPSTRRPGTPSSRRFITPTKLSIRLW